MRRFQSLPFAALLLASVAGAGCNDTPTTAQIVAGPITVFKAWWLATLFPDPVAPGDTSASQRTIPGSDYAYALTAPGWLPDQPEQPRKLVVLRSRNKVVATRHDPLAIIVTDEAFVGNCAAGAPLDADEAQRIVERIFPAEFVGSQYDPTTCTTSLIGDAGVSSRDGGGGD
jgi:hypothetical protein